MLGALKNIRVIGIDVGIVEDDFFRIKGKEVSSGKSLGNTKPLDF